MLDDNIDAWEDYYCKLQKEVKDVVRKNKLICGMML